MAGISVFTDGSCINNGAANARAGIGIFFGVDSPRNISRGLDSGETNNTAEVKAILSAVAELRPELERGDAVTIHTDSTYAMKVCGNAENFAERMRKSGWKTKYGSTIPNADLVREAWNICEQYPTLNMVHVAAHEEDDSPETFGNNHADALAVAGAGGRLRRMRMPPVPKERAPVRRPDRGGAAMQEGGGAAVAKVYLAVGYSQKDHAKSLGARWDPGAKLWYVPPYVVGARRAELVRRWGKLL